MPAFPLSVKASEEEITCPKYYDVILFKAEGTGNNQNGEDARGANQR